MSNGADLELVVKARDEASTLRIKNALENTGASWSDYKGQIDEVIKSGQRKAFSDDETRDSLSLLLAQTGDITEATKRYGLAQDLARGANIDVVSASKLLGKVTDENVNVLKRYGISVEKGSSETDLFAAVYAKFHGQAQTFADSTAGKMARFKDQMGELKESIGYAVLPVMTEGASLALKLGGALSDKVGGAIDAIGSKVGPAFRLFKDAVTGNFMDAHAAFLALPADLQQYGQLIFDVGSKIREALPAIKAQILETFNQVKSVFLDFKDNAVKAFHDLAADPSVKEAFGHIVDAAKLVVAYFRVEWPIIKLELKEVFEFAKAQIEGFIQAIKGIIEVIAGVIDLLVDLFHGRWKDAWGDMKEIAKGVLDLMIGNIKATLGNIPELLLDLAPKALSAAESVGKAIGNGIIGGLNDLLDSISGLEIIPAIKVAGHTVVPGVDLPSLGHIPSLATGAYVPSPTLALIGDAPGGEWVLNRSQMGALAGAGSGNGDIHIHMDNATIYGFQDFTAKVGRAMRDIRNRGGG